MNGADVYGRKITVCLPDESPFHFNNKKWNYLGRRQESPSPQRQLARKRSGSRGCRNRSYTPEEGRNRVNSSSSPSCADFGLIPVSDLTSSRGFKTPGGPTRQAADKIVGKEQSSPLSPNHVHTLPNSNSAKFYTRSSELLTPSDFQDKGQHKGESQTNEEKKVFNKLVAGTGSGVVSLSSATQQMSLKDIPLPPSGYKHMPPPNMVAPGSSTQAQAPSGKDSIDPIKLFEAASKDSQLFKPGLLGPMPTDSDGVPTQASFHPGAYFKHPEPQRHQQHQDHGSQWRSYSVPGGDHHPSSEGTGSVGQGRAAGSGSRSQSHSNGETGERMQTKQSQRQNNPEQQEKNKGRHLSGGFNSRSGDHTRPGSSGSNQRPSPSFDSNNTRPYSPSGFRPRLPSAPSQQQPRGNQRTPSPYTNIHPPPVRPVQRPRGSNIYRVPTPEEIGDPSSDYFHPDFVMARDSFVELIVSNLDYNISPSDWRKVIYATFHPHVKILSIQVRLQADNSSVATLRLPTEQDARFAIAQYHRRKIGYKRINVQLKSDCSHSPAESLRMDTIALLMEERENKMALSRLIDLFDKRFHKTVSVSDIYKMRDTIQITESGGGGRWVKLQPGIKRASTPSQTSETEVFEGLENRVCTIHCVVGSPEYVEALNLCMLPNVLLLRKHFAPQLHSLLLSHNGFIPLMSFPTCYAAEFSRIEVEKEGGIPLEHIISCVPGVEICVSKAGGKVIQFQQNREPFYDLMKGSAWQELGKISREVMELLRQQPTCTMPVSKFIPMYHHYFGKQCRVADYGYTKLQELFEAIPHAVQVLGTGDRRAITLSPRAQLKRFTTDIVKVVKAQPSKQIMLDKFPEAYEETMGRSLFLPHYGVCHMEDVLSDIPTTTLIVIEEGNHVLLALPRRDQTPQEVERTKKFALEVVDLLKTCPRCCMAFNKFIPAYHHHFGRQCRVADYGFSKLADLFEAVAHIVRLGEEGEERLIQLTVAEMRMVLCEQLTSLLIQTGPVLVSRLAQAYASRYNFGLMLEDYGVDSIKQLLSQLRNHIQVEIRGDQECVTVVTEFQIPVLGLQVMQLLMDESGGCLPLSELCTRYQSTFGCLCDLEEIKDKLPDYIQIEESGDGGGLIRLSLQQSLGQNLRLLLLHRPGHRAALGELYSVYRAQYGVDLSPALYGFMSLHQLLMSFPHILEVRGKPPNKYVVLSSTLGTPGVLPPAFVKLGASQQSTVVSGQEKRSEPVVSGAPNALMHASKLWDSAIISHSPPNTASTQVASVAGESTRIIKMLQASHEALTSSSSQSGPVELCHTKAKKEGQKEPKLSPVKQPVPVSAKGDGALELSPNGVPLAWQMLPGGQKLMSGNLSCDAAAIAKKIVDKEVDDDLFSPNNHPLDTSSATSQLNSSSQSSVSTTNSPVKSRPKPRIAAKFGGQQ